MNQYYFFMKLYSSSFFKTRMNKINTRSSNPCYVQPTTLGRYENFIANFNSHFNTYTRKKEHAS